MKPMTTALLFGGAMALSALSIAFGEGCYDMATCPFNECVQAWYPHGAPCCDNAGGPQYYYACTVNLAGEGNDRLVVTPVNVGACYTGADEAENEAPTLAEATWGNVYPNTTPQEALCQVSACPEAP